MCIRDRYQLGVLLYEMLAGVPPFAQYDGAALLRAVLEEDPPPPGRVAWTRHAVDARRIDADLDAICLRALRKEPAQRYASVDALLADLERWRQGEPVRASDGGWWYRGAKFARRHWRSLAVALFAADGMERNLDFERRHQAIIERFGRYPHRNAILGRQSTAAELEFLKTPGSAF